MANYEVESANLAVNIAAAENITAQVSNALPLDVTIGKSAELNVGQATVYIESGKAELRPLVNAAAESASNAAESAISAAENAISAAESADRAEAAAESVVSDKTYIFEQGEASDTWYIQHNLGKFPSVEIVDTAGNRFFPAVQWVDENNCIATMNGACKGKAFLN